MFLLKALEFNLFQKKLPVNEHSIFAIGSTTKAFTAAALGKLVESGEIQWDDRVIDYIPEFELHNPAITNMFTIRDLLTHRSGLPRGDLLWFASDFLDKIYWRECGI